MYGSGSSSSMLGTSTRHGSVAPTPRWMLPQGNRRIGNNTNNSNSNSNTLPSVTTPSPVAVVKLASRTAPSWPWTPRRRTESVSTVLSLGEPTMAAAARDDEEEVTDGTSGHPPDEDDYDDDDPAERSRSSSSRMRLETAEDSMDSKMGGVDGFVVHDAGRLLAHSQSSSSSQQQTNNTTSTHLNILEWLQRDCPLDVIPLVLSFGGPQTAAAVSRTNRQWHAVVAREATWRGMCEGLYKVWMLYVYFYIYIYIYCCF